MKLLLIIAGALSAGSSGQSEADAPVEAKATAVISADFSRWVDYPLVKSKFGGYNSGFVPGGLETYRRDLPLASEVRPDSLRFDGGLGSPRGILFSEPPLVSCRASSLLFSFDEMDAFIALLMKHGIRPYWCYSYVPECLTGQPPDFRRPPNDLDAWGLAVQMVAGRLREVGGEGLYHEIYNEPDNRDFFRGSRDDYLKMYERGAAAVKAADPDARVGGPSLAFTSAWMRPFVDYVVERGLPLDFFSFHFYPGVPWDTDGIAGVLHMVRRELDRCPELVCTEMHLNEYNALPINYPENGPQQKHPLAAALLKDFVYFASQPFLTKVHWAQLMDTGGGNWSGLIGIDGHPKAAFNAYKVYSMMPIDRREVQIDSPPGIGAVASSNRHSAAMAVWNISESNHLVRLALNNLPFVASEIRISRIDSLNASSGDSSPTDDLRPVRRTVASASSFVWTGEIPRGGVLHVEAVDPAQPRASRSRLPEPLYVLNYYPDRQSHAYADFDRDEWTARLGMTGQTKGHAQVGVVAENLPEHLDVLTELDGALRPINANSLLGLRLDYSTSSGDWSRSVLFHGRVGTRPDLYHPLRSAPFPWGTKRQADETVRVRDMRRFRINLKNHCPPGWSGRITLTFILQDAGAGVRAKVTLR